MKAILKAVFINVTIFLCILSLANIMSVSVVALYNRFEAKPHDQSHLLPNYTNVGWAKEHFAEYEQQSVVYESYYGWRRLPFKGKTINIDENGLRQTYSHPTAAATRTAAFFGGSTMWGTGADDVSTIPSAFAKANPDYAVSNFGEQGYSAHQGLNLFLKKYYEGYRPDLVVFYDGVNEVGKCRRELHPYSHSREHRIKVVLDEAGSESPESLLFVVLPLKNLVGKLGRVLAGKTATSFYDCHEDATKADLVARNLVSDWRLMKTLVESYGGTFVAILQPAAYFSQTKNDRITLDREMGAQFDAVYPRVLDYIEGEFSDLKGYFHDFRQALDMDRYLYIDFCHLSPDGNEVVASRISLAVQRQVAGDARRAPGTVLH